MSTEATTKARQKRKADLVYIMGGKCVICGYDKCQQALEFHHIDKSTKKYNISSGNCHSWEEDIEELKKCALLCSNCHKELEVFNYEVFCTFDEKRFLEVNKEKEKKETICKNCGKKISQKAKFCGDCWSLMNRKVERPSREELKDMIRTLPFLQIGRLFNVSDNTIRKWCDSYNLPRRATEIKTYSKEEWDKI